MSFKEIILQNFVTLSLIIGMGTLVITNGTFDKRTTRLFSWYLFIVLFIDLADMADYYFQFLTTVNPLRYLSSAVGYILRPTAVVMLICILLRNKNKSYYFLWAPVILIGIIALTSCFTHIMFWFDEQNRFQRGPLCYISHIGSGIYVLILIILTIQMHRSKEPGEIITIIYTVVLCTVATVLESTHNYKFLLPGAMSVSGVLYYTFLYVQTYKRDLLTGLLNRRSFYFDTMKMSGSPMSIVSMDLNELKQINDSEGHTAGDMALKTFANVAQSVSADEYRIYRTGGDEFMAIGKNRSEKETLTFIEKMQTALSQTKYMSAFGLALYTPGENFEEILSLADARMYKDKNRYKHRLIARD